MASVAFSNRTYHVVVWGATGFTGKLVCRHIAENYQGEVKWAMAGRDETKLQKVREFITEINADCEKVPIITAQLDDQASLDSMIGQTRVVLSTAGPFARIGTPIVESCIRNSTHYCDTTGETPWVKKLVKSHHEEAQQKNVKIVPCCGFDCIPFDLGTYYLAQHAIKTYDKGLQQISALISPKSKGGLSGGTLETALSMSKNLTPEESKAAFNDGMYLVPSDVQGGRKRATNDVILKYLRETQTYMALSIMYSVNSQVVYRSYAQQGYKYGEKFLYQEGVELGNVFSGVIYLAVILSFLASVLTPGIRGIMRKYFLPAPGQGPSWEAMTNGRFSVRFVGLLDGDEKQPQMVEAKVGDAHRDPGYWGTSRYVLESALCLALQHEELKQGGYMEGGILTTASAMGNVLIERLRKAGVEFDIVKP